jgi:Tol biopolymer transport system component
MGLVPTENTTDGDFGVIDLDTQQITWLLKTPANEMSPVFSPDHKWVAFITNEPGRTEAYVWRLMAAASSCRSCESSPCPP